MGWMIPRSYFMRLRVGLMSATSPLNSRLWYVSYETVFYTSSVPTRRSHSPSSNRASVVMWCVTAVGVRSRVGGCVLWPLLFENQWWLFTAFTERRVVHFRHE